MATHAESPIAAGRRPRLPERYRPVRRTAAGGTGIVWCVEDDLLGRRVAVKLLADPYAHDPTAVRRFKREARAAARLSGHPNVITIFDVAETEPDELGHVRPFIVMEHLSGGTVADALRVGEASLEDAVRWLYEAASALDYAHARGVLHRDIKPANLLLNPQRRLHVADFGIAQMGTEDTVTSPGQVLGTAGYLAPERALGHSATVATDLYALAVAAFELLTGERPFTAASYIAQARQHLAEPPPAASERNPHLPVAIDPVLARGMAKEPGRRWKSAEAFAVAVDRALAPSAAPGTARAAAVSRARRAMATRCTGIAVPSPSRPPRAPTAVVSKTAATDTPEAPPARLLTLPRLPRPAPGRPAALGAAAAVLVAVLVVGFAWAERGGSIPAVPTAKATTRSAVARAAHAAVPRRTLPAPTPQSHPNPAAVPTQAVAAATASPPSPPPAPAGDLEAQGHALLTSGSYSAAIPVLRQAMANASPSSLIYAYAMYDLGEALTLSGNPAAGVAMLQKRLQIPNQTGVVRRALKAAQREAGD